VYVTFYISRAVPQLMLAVIATMLATLLMLYAFVENFHIVPR
jgi:hypothetical protein